MLCAPLLFPAKILASWAYSFVVWDGYLYVVTDELVEKVDKEIGHVAKYSDREGTYSGNFSNVYPKGTKYYSIIGVSSDEAIAVQDEKGLYIKANRSGKYAGNKYDLTSIILSSFLLVAVAILGFYFLNKRR